VVVPCSCGPITETVCKQAAQRHRSDLDVGARLIGVHLPEHVTDAQRRALAVGDDDLDLLHVGHYDEVVGRG